MVQTEDLKLEDEAIYLPPFYFAEVGTANRLLALLRKAQEQDLFAKKMDVQALSKETGVEYDEVQLQAIEEAIRSKVMVLTGGPGTGKDDHHAGNHCRLEAHGTAHPAGSSYGACSQTHE